MALRIVAENNITNDHIFCGVCHTPCLGILVAWSTTWIVSLPTISPCCRSLLLVIPEILKTIPVKIDHAFSLDQRKHEWQTTLSK